MNSNADNREGHLHFRNKELMFEQYQPIVRNSTLLSDSAQCIKCTRSIIQAGSRMVRYLVLRYHVQKQTSKYSRNADRVVPKVHPHPSLHQRARLCERTDARIATADTRESHPHFRNKELMFE